MLAILTTYNPPLNLITSCCMGLPAILFIAALYDCFYVMIIKQLLFSVSNFRNPVYMRRFGGSFQDPLQSAEGRRQDRQAGAFNGEDWSVFRSLHCSSIHRHWLLRLPALTLGGLQSQRTRLIRCLGDASNLHVTACWHHVGYVDLVSQDPPYLAALLCPPTQGRQGEPRRQEGTGRGLDQTGERQ